MRLCKPETGSSIFAKVQERIGGAASATMRGEEMMAGEEKRVLEVKRKHKRMLGCEYREIEPSESRPTSQ